MLARVGEGDEQALRELYLLYQPRLARFLRRFTDNLQLIEEVVNDTLMVVWESSRQFRGDSSPTTWIMGIGYKKMLKGLQRSRAFPAPLPDETMPDEPLQVAAVDVAGALQHLSETHAAVVVLTYEFGYSYREISEILQCPENTVKTRMFHARKVLKNILEGSHE